jgi:hypothetical protein
MTIEAAIVRMREIAALSKGDPEAGHSEADKLLCDFLRANGHGALVDEFDKVDAWYA